MRRCDLLAAATAVDILVLSGKVLAEGNLHFRGTMGVDEMASVGFVEVRMAFELDTDAKDAKLKELANFTERYFVVLQTILRKPRIKVSAMRVV